MNSRFFKKIIKEHLLPHFPGFVSDGKGSMLAVPMGHIWRGFGFSGIPGSPNQAYVYFNVLPLYMPIKFDHVGIGKRIRFNRKYLAEWYQRTFPNVTMPTPASNTVEVWVWDEEQADEVIRELVNTLKPVKAQYLDKLTTPEEIGVNGPTLIGTKGANQLEILAYSLAYVGQYGQALEMMEELCQLHESMHRPGEAKETDHINRERIRDLLRTSPEAAKAQLLEWEQQSIKVLKLEKFAN